MVCMVVLTPACFFFVLFFFSLSPGLWTTSMITHLTGPCWSRKQHSKRPPQGDRGNRHKPPQASKLTNPRVTWKVSSKQPSDVFSAKNRDTNCLHLFKKEKKKKEKVDLEHSLPKKFMKHKMQRNGVSSRMHPTWEEKKNSIGMFCKSKDVLGKFDY